MTTMRRVCSVVCACLLAAACGGTSQEEQRQLPPVEDTAFGDAVGTMDRARAVEDTTLQHKQDVDRAIDEQETGQQ